MGSIGTYRPKGMSDFDFLTKDYGMRDGRNGGPGFLDVARKNGVMYGAYRTDEGDVIATVMAFTFDRNGYFVFRSGDDETVGPYQYDCPKRIYDLLTPTDNESALRWREKVEEQLARQERARKIKPGTVIKTASKIGFTNGAEYDTFRFVKGSTFNAIAGGDTPYLGPTVTFRRWRTMDFEIVEVN